MTTSNEEQTHRRHMAYLVRQAALELQEVENYWHDNNLPGDFSTPETGFPFSQSLDEQTAAMFEWVEKLDPDFYKRPGVCLACGAPLDENGSPDYHGHTDNCPAQ